MSVSRAMMYTGMMSDSHGAIWATNTASMNCRRPRQRIRATAKEAPSATSSASSTVPSVTSRLLRQNRPKPSASTARRKWSSVQVRGTSRGWADWMSRLGVNAVVIIQ